jgi:hypothetical protein
MPETRYHTTETFDGKGNLIETKQIPYEVSDEELEREAAERTVAALSALPDSELTTAQMKRLVKALARLRR